MPKDSLFELIKNQQYYLLILIYVVYVLNWTILLKLGLVINKRTIDPKRIIFPWALTGALYSLLAKQFIPDYLFFFGNLFIVFLLLKRISKLEATKAFFTAVISLLTGAFSVLLFGQASFINIKFRTIMFSTKGVVIGSIFEAILPVVFLVFYSNKTKNKEKNAKTSSPPIIFSISLLFLLYCISMIILYFITNYNQLIFRQVLISEAILVSLTIYVLWRIRRINRIEQERCELFHSTYLLKTILSKQREYRNCFQVIRAMAEGGKTQEIVAYIDNILNDISMIEDFKGLNPIFTAYHVAEEIKAREKGVKVTTKTMSALANMREPFKVYAIFKDLLQYFVAYEEKIISDDHQIRVEVSEDELSYSFKIMRNNGAVDASQESDTTPKLDRDSPLRPIAKRLKKLGGKFYPYFKEDELIGCQFIVGKVRDYRDLFPLNFGT